MMSGACQILNLCDRCDIWCLWSWSCEGLLLRGIIDVRDYCSEMALLWAVIVEGDY